METNTHSSLAHAIKAITVSWRKIKLQPERKGSGPSTWLFGSCI